MKSRNGWSQHEIIIRVPSNSSVDPVDGAPVAAGLEDVGEVLAIVTVGEPGQDFALAHAVTDGEAGGYDL